MKNRIKDLREDHDMRQKDLADATGIDQRTISNYETGKTSPDSEALIKLADYFNVSIDYLVCRSKYDFSSSKKKKEFIDKLQTELEELKRNI